MPVEPPVVSPRSLAEAYAILAGAPASAGRRRHGPAGPADRRDRPAARARHRPVARRGAARDPRPGRRCSRSGALTTYTQIRRSDDCARACAVAGRRSRHDRRRADPEPGHDRGQRHERVAGGRHAAGPARARRRARRRRAGRRARRSRRASSGRRTARPRCATASCCSASGSRSSTGRHQAFRKVGTRRAQAISKVVLAASWRARPGVARRPDRARVGRRDAGPRRRPPRPPSRAPPRRRRPSTRRGRGAARRAAPDRRRPVHRRLSSGGRRPDPAAHARGRDMTELGANHYGKDTIRLVKVDKASAHHEVRDLTVDVELAGDFDGLVRRRRQRDWSIATDTDEEHGLRVRAGAPHRRDRVVRDRPRAALRRGGPGVERHGLDPRARLGAT